MTKYEALNICYKEKLSAKAKCVFTYFVYRADKCDRCFPSLKTIAEECALSVSTVQRAIRELMQQGLIAKNVRYREDGSQTSNLYAIVIKTVERAKQAVKNAQQLMDAVKKIKEAKQAARKALQDKITENISDADEQSSAKTATVGTKRRTFSLLSILTTPPGQYDHPITVTV